MVRRLAMSRFVLRNEERKDRGQEHKDERLHKSDEQFQKIKWYRDQPRERRHDVTHRFEHDFASEDVSEQPKAERNGPEQNRNDFQPADDEKNEDHQDLQNAGGIPFGSEEMNDHAADAVGLDRPDDPADKKDRSHRERQIQVRIGAAEQGPIDMKISRRIVMPPADGADAREAAQTNSGRG